MPEQSKQTKEQATSPDGRRENVKGYQPTYDDLDPSRPPKGGSGVRPAPRKVTAPSDNGR